MENNVKAKINYDAILFLFCLHKKYIRVEKRSNCKFTKPLVLQGNEKKYDVKFTLQQNYYN